MRVCKCASRVIEYIFHRTILLCLTWSTMAGLGCEGWGEAVCGCCVYRTWVIWQVYTHTTYTTIILNTKHMYAHAFIYVITLCTQDSLPTALTKFDKKYFELYYCFSRTCHNWGGGRIIEMKRRSIED